MDEKKSPQNRYCCVPLCNQKGSTGPNGEKVGFFNLPTDQPARDQWLHVIRRDTGKHFTITDATKVCSLHFKKEKLKKSLGIGGLSYVDGAVPSVFAWKRSSPRKRKPPTIRASPSNPEKIRAVKARTLLNMNAVPGRSSETVSTDVNAASDFLESDSIVMTSEERCATPDSPNVDSSSVGGNQLSCQDLQRKLGETEKLLEETKESTLKLESELEKLGKHAFKLSEKCENLEKRMFTLNNFISDEAIAFYTGFPSYDVFIATFTYLNPGENAENIRFWRSIPKDVDPEYYEREPELGVGPGRPRTLHPKEEFFLVMCRLRQGFAERHLGHLFNISESTDSRIIISWINFMYLKLGQLNIWPSRKVVDDYMPNDFKSKYPNTRVIIDCTELKCQMPSSLLLNSELFSSYKNHTTLKGLIGISPAGHITFISELYTGSISDREITMRSGFLDLPFDANDSVMAGKGFTIEDLLPVGVTEYSPLFG